MAPERHSLFNNWTADKTGYQENIFFLFLHKNKKTPNSIMDGFFKYM